MTQKEFDKFCMEWNKVYTAQVVFFTRMYKGNSSKIAQAVLPLKAAMIKAKAEKAKEGIEPCSTPTALSRERYRLQRRLKHALKVYKPKFAAHYDTANATVQFKEHDGGVTFTIEIPKHPF